MPDYSQDPGAATALRQVAEVVKDRACFYRQEAARFVALAEECDRQERELRVEANRYPKPAGGPDA